MIKQKELLDEQLKQIGGWILDEMVPNCYNDPTNNRTAIKMTHSKKQRRQEKRQKERSRGNKKEYWKKIDEKKQKK